MFLCVVCVSRDDVQEIRLAKEEIRLPIDGKKRSKLLSSGLGSMDIGNMPHMCFSPRVLFKAWKLFHQRSESITLMLTKISINFRQKTLRKYLNLFIHKADVVNRDMHLRRVKTESEAMMSSSDGLVKRFEKKSFQIITESCVNSVASKLLACALQSSVTAFKRIVLRAWR